MLGDGFGQKIDPLQQATLKLRAHGYSVDRADFLPAPLLGLYVVSGPNLSGVEMTERQVIGFASQH